MPNRNECKKCKYKLSRQCKCKRCGNVWDKRVDNPKECPECKSLKWRGDV